MLRERELLPYLDLAYQGYGDGIDEDAYAVRALASAGGSFFVANSFSKSMSVYGERAGALSVVCADAAEAELVLGPAEGHRAAQLFEPGDPRGRIVARVLADADLRADLGGRRGGDARAHPGDAQGLHGVSVAKMPGRDFGYFLTQRGMFSYTGLSAAQVDRLREEYAVYLVRSGRICVAGPEHRQRRAHRAGRWPR